MPLMQHQMQFALWISLFRLWKKVIAGPRSFDSEQRLVATKKRGWELTLALALRRGKQQALDR